MTTAAIHLGLFGPTEMMMSAFTTPGSSGGLLGLLFRRRSQTRPAAEKPQPHSARLQELELQALRNAYSWPQPA